MNGISGFTSQMRLTGLSGFDTEGMVTELMRAERMPLDALKQKRTLIEWKREAYREVITSLRSFKTRFFDIVNRSSYLLSQSSIKAMSAKSSNSDYVSVSASSSVKTGTFSVHVSQLATADTSISTERISTDISGIIVDKNLADKKIYVTLDGVTKEIALKDYSSYSESDMAQDIENSIASAFGSNKINVEISSGEITIGTVEGSGVTKITVTEPAGEAGGLAGLGIISGASNRISLNKTLASLKNSGIPFEFDGGGFAIFRINGETITAEATDTLQKVFDKINNNAKANAQISYDEIRDKITIKSKITGAGDNLKLEALSGDFFGGLKIDIAKPTIEGQDAKIYIDGSSEPIVRSTNTFTINGITFTLNKAHALPTDTETITVEQDTDTVINNIKSFIEEYNKLIDSLNGRLTEKYDRNYLPLTDEQKEAMKEADIEKWEKKAKTGLLRNDSILEQLTTSMRRALFETVEGVGITLKDIGIESKSYTDKGKLYLDENKLREALQNKPDEVAKLLNGVSPDNPSYTRNLTTEQRQDRYKRSGVLQRLSDIIEDNISTIRNSDDKKGILLEKAGMEGDLSDTRNLINDELKYFDKRIDDLVDKLIRKEENYYKKFSALETMLNRMNQQSAWLFSQFGGGQ